MFNIKIKKISSSSTCGNCGLKFKKLSGKEFFKLLISGNIFRNVEFFNQKYFLNKTFNN